MDRSRQCLVIAIGDGERVDSDRVLIAALPAQDVLDDESWLSNEATIGQPLCEVGIIDSEPDRRGMYVATEEYVCSVECAKAENGNLCADCESAEPHYTLTQATVEDLEYYGFNQIDSARALVQQINEAIGEK